MSFDWNDDMLVWVGDLDCYINIDAISRANEREAEQDALEAEFETIQNALEVELECLGDIALFSNTTISSRTIYSLGVKPDQWYWMLRRAEKSLGQAHTRAEIESGFLKVIMSLARRYAVARYARFEGLSLSSVITAIFPHGIRALLFNYMAGERLLSDPSFRKEIQQTLHLAVSTPNLTAYDQAGLVQRSLHQLAIDAAGKDAHLQLNKGRMRNMLALSRLHFCILECQVQSVAELQKINLRYQSARAAEELGFDTSQEINGRRVKNWRLRSLHPLTFYFPASFRDSLRRLINQDTAHRNPIERSTAANEISLAYCGMELMRRQAVEKAKCSE